MAFSPLCNMDVPTLAASCITPRGLPPPGIAGAAGVVAAPAVNKIKPYVKQH
jgi:hypothetical protein